MSCSKFSACSHECDFEGHLNKYYEKYVKTSREERSKVLKVVQPIIDKIVDFISTESGGVFGKTLIRVGSYYQHLKTGLTDEFDFNVPLHLHYIFLVWGNCGDRRSITYGFKQIDDDVKAKTTSQQDLTIVERCRPLYPDNGCSRLPVNCITAFLYPGMTFYDDLVPYLVKRVFKRHLSAACEQVRQDEKKNNRRITEDSISLCQQDHGPACTITFNGVDFGLTHDVSVDFAPTIQAHLPYLSSFGWPRYESIFWLSPELIQSIMSKGINLVAKQNFFWSYSFAEIEKEMARTIDQPGECRRKVHRTMKVLFKNQWRHGSSLSSYELKNAWLWFCEKNHREKWDDTPGTFAVRLVECAMHFRDLLMSPGGIPQYFNTSKNLLEDKDPKMLKATAQNITEFLQNHQDHVLNTIKRSLNELLEMVNAMRRRYD